MEKRIAAVELLQRRQFLKTSVSISVAFMGSFIAPSLMADGIACTEPEAASGDGLRRSMNYQPIGKEQTKTCVGCTFYREAGETKCGRCQILSGIVNSEGTCDAWSS